MKRGVSVDSNPGAWFYKSTEKVGGGCRGHPPLFHSGGVEDPAPPLFHHLCPRGWMSTKAIGFGSRVAPSVEDLHREHLGHCLSYRPSGGGGLRRPQRLATDGYPPPTVDPFQNPLFKWKSMEVLRAGGEGCWKAPSWLQSWDPPQIK